MTINHGDVFKVGAKYFTVCKVNDNFALMLLTVQNGGEWMIMEGEKDGKRFAHCLVITKSDNKLTAGFMDFRSQLPAIQLDPPLKMYVYENVPDLGFLQYIDCIDEFDGGVTILDADVWGEIVA